MGSIQNLCHMPGYRALAGPDNPAYFVGKSAETLGMNIGFV
jgi:hypothetical protein